MIPSRQAAAGGRRWPLSPLGYCALLALLGVALRVALADQIFFRLLHVPSHDLSQGIGFFATSMHSVRLTGDLAWWFPGSFSGYAQYFQGFFSPLAPTYGHIVFIAWAHLVAILGTLGIAIPEYYQYLVVNHLVFPFLAIGAFAYFASHILRTRTAVALAVMVYVLSGIGIWYSAWFFFQEAFSVFFLLGTSVALLQRPTPGRAFAWLAAVLVQLASLNYWTVYNIFFVAILGGAYAATHWNQCVRLGAWTVALRRRYPAAMALAGVAFAAVAIAWAALIIGAMGEQSGRHVRAQYSAEQALRRIQEIRRYTTELFNPLLARAVGRYPIINEAHNARYIGVLLLPLIGVALLGAWTRRTRWLVASAALVLAVCLGSPFVVAAWAAIPFMDRIQHVLYFYSHYWQILAVLVSALGLDLLVRAMSRAMSRATRRAALWVLSAAVALAALGMVHLAWTSHEYAPGDVSLEANLRAALMLGFGSVLLLRAVISMRWRELRFATGVLLLLLFIDLSAYFYGATRADIAMTARRPWPGVTPTPEQRRALATPWGPLRTDRGFSGGVDEYLPIGNDFWPVNAFILPAEFSEGPADAFRDYIRSAPPFIFYDGAEAIAEDRPIPRAAAKDLPSIDRELRIVAPSAPPTATPHARPMGDAVIRWNHLGYNSFEVEVTAPRDGWLMVRQLHDPRWRVTLDGGRAVAFKANYMGMAVAVPEGRHVLLWEYWPLPRRLYWLSALMLEAVVAVFLGLAFLSRRRSGASGPGGRPRAAPASPS